MKWKQHTKTPTKWNEDKVEWIDEWRDKHKWGENRKATTAQTREWGEGKQCEQTYDIPISKWMPVVVCSRFVYGFA